MNDNSSLYMLPDRDYTYDVDLYVNAWRKLGDDVASLIPGAYCNAFDPGLTIVRKGDCGRGIDVPADLALAIQSLMQQNKLLEVQALLEKSSG